MHQTVRAWGHENVAGTHETTIEITKEDFLSHTGDCIIGVRAEKALADLREDVKKKIRSGADVTVRIKVGEFVEEIRGKGHKDLALSDGKRMIIRRSDFVCPRTLMIKADKAAKDLDRGMIELLRTGHEMEFRISVE